MRPAELATLLLSCSALRCSGRLRWFGRLPALVPVAPAAWMAFA